MADGRHEPEDGGMRWGVEDMPPSDEFMEKIGDPKIADMLFDLTDLVEGHSHPVPLTPFGNHPHPCCAMPATHEEGEGVEWQLRIVGVDRITLDELYQRDYVLSLEWFRPHDDQYHSIRFSLGQEGALALMQDAARTALEVQVMANYVYDENDEAIDAVAYKGAAHAANPTVEPPPNRRQRRAEQKAARRSGPDGSPPPGH